MNIKLLKKLYLKSLKFRSMLDVNSNIFNKLLTLLTAILLSTIFLKLLSTPVVCVLMGVIIFLCLLMKKSCINDRSSIGIIIFIFIALFYQLMGNGESFNNYLLKSLYFMTGLLLTYNLDELTRTQHRFLLYVLLSLLTFSIIMTFLILLTDPMAVRHYGYGVKDTDIPIDSSSLFGMYSYGVGETFAFMMPSLLCFSLGIKNVFLKYLMFVIVAMGIITQFMATLTTSFFLSLGASVLVLFFFLYQKRVMFREKIILVLLMSSLFIYFIPKLNDFENTLFTTKMEDIQTSLDSGQSTGQLQSRSDLYMQSIEVFLSNPILGFGNIATQENFYETRFVGMHTTIFDYLGLYGIFALFLFMPWRNVLCVSLCILPQQIRRIYKISLFALFILLLLKGPVSIGVNFFFSTYLLTLLYYNEYYRIHDVGFYEDEEYYEE